MSLPLIILTGLLLAAAGSGILLLLPPVFRLPWKTTVKRCIWFTEGWKLRLQPFSAFLTECGLRLRGRWRGILRVFSRYAFLECWMRR